jgi:3,4-dihydroxy 2-butanone 4-phosphate synthase/GTP cyclohydrolase II
VQLLNLEKQDSIGTQIENVNSSPFASIEKAIDALKNGNFVVVVDDANRENEGDLIIPAQRATPQNIAFMTRYTSGVICAPLHESRLNELDLPLMVANNNESHKTAFTISVDYLHGTTTGISAADRAATLNALANPSCRKNDFARPGHIFPLKYSAGGVLKRPGHTEAAVDLAVLAGYSAAGAICEITKDDGSMARLPDLVEFAAQHQLPIISIADLISYRLRTENSIYLLSEARLPTKYGEFTIYAYQSQIDGIEHIALVKGQLQNSEDVLVRVHSECMTGDIFGSLRCDCGQQLEKAMETIEQQGLGVIIYIKGHEGRGIGLANKLKAYELQDQGLDTVDANLNLGFKADDRKYHIAAYILKHLGVKSIKIVTNNPHKINSLIEHGVKVTGRFPISLAPHEHNQGYLLTKKAKLGHLFH